MATGVRAALYLRVSTGRQADSDLSILDQRRQAKAYCASRGWQFVADYVEPGASATDDRRPEFQRIIDAATAKPPTFDVILVHSFIAATSCARWPSVSRWTRKKFASWGRKACLCVRSSQPQAQKRQVLECPVLYRSGAPDTIRTCDLHLRRAARAASNDLPILLAMRRRKEANSPAPLVLVVLRCCRHGCRRNGSAKSLDWRRDRGGG
jgi:Resolvase, N terminal domain